MSLKRALLVLLCVHLAVLFLQLPLRALLVDSTYWRDAVLLTAVGICALGFLLAPRRLRLSRLDICVGMLFAYGTANLAVGISGDGNVLGRTLEYRNFYLPFLLYWPARSAFTDQRNRTMFVSIAFTFCAVLLVSPLLESMYSLTGLPMRWIPWYAYAFDHDPRFIGNSATAYLRPQNTPILGLQGFPHYSAPVLVALFAFILPSVGAQLRRLEGSRLRPLNALSRVPLSVYLVVFGMAVVVFRVRTHIVTALVVLFVLPGGWKAVRMLAYASAATVAAVFAVPARVTAELQRFTSGFVSDQGPASFDLILSVSSFLFIVSAPIRQILLGLGPGFDEAAAVWEMKLLYFTAQLGLVWLLLFGALVVTVLRVVFATRGRRMPTSFEYRVAQGCLGMTVVYLLDAGHYMRMMNWPSLDLWVVTLALLASVAERQRIHESSAQDRSESAPPNPTGNGVRDGMPTLTTI